MKKTILKAAAVLVLLVGTPPAIWTLLRPAGPVPAQPAAEMPVIPFCAPDAAGGGSNVVVVVNGTEITDPVRKAAILSEARSEVHCLLGHDAKPERDSSPGVQRRQDGQPGGHAGPCGPPPRARSAATS